MAWVPEGGEEGMSVLPQPNDQYYCIGQEFLELKADLAKEQEHPCPFCGEMACKHWDGMGWWNPKYRRKIERKVIPTFFMRNKMQTLKTIFWSSLTIVGMGVFFGFKEYWWHWPVGTVGIIIMAIIYKKAFTGEWR